MQSTAVLHTKYCADMMPFGLRCEAKPVVKRLFVWFKTVYNV